MQSIWRNRLLAAILTITTVITVGVLVWLLSSVQTLNKETNEISEFFRDNRLWHMAQLQSELHKFRFELLNAQNDYNEANVNKASVAMELVWNRIDVLIQIRPNRQSSAIEEEVLALFDEMLTTLHAFEKNLYAFTPAQLSELLQTSGAWLDLYRLQIQDLHILQFSLIRDFSNNTTNTYSALSLQMLFLFGFVFVVQIGLTALMIYYAKASKRADIANMAKTDFLANMTHELRTPLNGVLGTIQLMKEENEFNQDMLDTLQASSESLYAQINDILDFSRIETGEMLLDERDFDLQVLIRQLKSVVGTNARQKGVELKFELPNQVTDSIWLRADETKLRQILLNLLNNAIKFTDPGGSVRLFVHNDGSDLRFDVTDTGIGISEQAQKHIFEPFRQAQNSTSREYGGSGLGLAISRQLATLLNGTLTVSSAPGEGATFTLIVPMQRALAPATPMSLTAQTERTLDGSVRVLLVEDNHVNQKVALAMLSHLQVSAVLAENAEQALQLCSEQTYDCILMDIQMPGMDGFQCTQELRARGYNKPIFALTANSSEDIRHRSLKAGMDDFLTKPIRLETLKEKISQL